jgi:hypothetical protein
MVSLTFEVEKSVLNEKLLWPVREPQEVEILGKIWELAASALKITATSGCNVAYAEVAFYSTAKDCTHFWLKEHKLQTDSLKEELPGNITSVREASLSNF